MNVTIDHNYFDAIFQESNRFLTGTLAVRFPRAKPNRPMMSRIGVKKLHLLKIYLILLQIDKSQTKIRI